MTKKLTFLAAAALVIAVSEYLFGHMAAAGGLALATAFIGWPDANLSHVPVKRGDPSKMSGAEAYELFQSWVKATTDGAGTIYYLAELPSNAVVTALDLLMDAAAGMTDVDFGVYRVKPDGSIQTCTDGGGASTGGAKSDGSDAGSIFTDALDAHLGYAAGSPHNCLTALSIANSGVPLWKLLGFTDPKLKDDRYVLGMRVASADTNAPNIAARVRYIQG